MELDYEHCLLDYGYSVILSYNIDVRTLWYALHVCGVVVFTLYSKCETNVKSIGIVLSRSPYDCYLVYITHWIIDY